MLDTWTRGLIVLSISHFIFLWYVLRAWSNRSPLFYFWLLFYTSTGGDLCFVVLKILKIKIKFCSCSKLCLLFYLHILIFKIRSDIHFNVLIMASMVIMCHYRVWHGTSPGLVTADQSTVTWTSSGDHTPLTALLHKTVLFPTLDSGHLTAGEVSSTFRTQSNFPPATPSFYKVSFHRYYLYIRFHFHLAFVLHLYRR